MLNETQKSKWHEDGYLKVEGFFDPVTREKISASFETRVGDLAGQGRA
ncbi:hypothetical protein OKW30_007916 [Paraburkholderia sp. Clong3]